MNLLKSYYTLCKPNVVYMMLITAVVGMLLAQETVPSISYMFIALLGIALCSGSAAAINQVIDRNADASMNRTDKRPLPQGDISPSTCFNFCTCHRPSRINNTLCICKYFNHVFNNSFFNWLCFYIYSLFKKSYTTKYCNWRPSGSSPTTSGLGFNYKFN